MSDSKTYTVTDNASGKSFDLPVHENTVGPDVVDIRKFYAQSGAFTYDQAIPHGIL